MNIQDMTNKPNKHSELQTAADRVWHAAEMPI